MQELPEDGIIVSKHVAMKNVVLLCKFHVHLFSFVKENKLFKSRVLIYLPYPLRGVTLQNKLDKYINIILHTALELYLNSIVSIPLCTYNNFIKLCRLYTTNK